MIGKIHSLAGVLFASAMMLAGCVAQVDESDVDESAAALIDSAGEVGAPPAAPRVIEADDPVANVIDSVTGGDGSSDPQPNPWVPTASLPIGPNDPGPTPVQPKTR